jgi:hypothetical protein
MNYSKKKQPKTNFSSIALQNLNDNSFHKSIKNRTQNILLPNTSNLKKYNIFEDQKYYYPYDKTNKFFKSLDSTKIINKDSRHNRFSELNHNTRRTMPTNRMAKENHKNKAIRGRSTSEFFEQFENIQNRFNTGNLNDFMRVYKSNDHKRKHFRDSYGYDSFIASVGQIDPKGEFKLDTVKNTINAPDPKSSFFRTKDNHFVRKGSHNFFMDERLRKRNKDIISFNKLHKIISRENKFHKEKENKFNLQERKMNLKRKNKLDKSKPFLI